MFSRKDRGGNTLGETFEVEMITVLSETTAAVTFIKQPTGKKAVAFFFWIASRMKARWEYFFATYNHLVGLERVANLLHEVEQHNFKVSTAPQARPAAPMPGSIDEWHAQYEGAAR